MIMINFFPEHIGPNILILPFGIQGFTLSLISPIV